MKKIFKMPKMSTIFGVMFLQCAVVFAAQAGVTAAVGAVSGAPGDLVELPITFANNGLAVDAGVAGTADDAGAVGVQLDVTFPAGFTPEADGTGAFAVQGAAIPFVVGGHQLSTSANGQVVTLVISDQTAPVGLIGDDVLVTVHVRIGAGTAAGAHSFTLSNVVAGDVDADAVTVDGATAGDVTVTGGGGGAPEVGIAATIAAASETGPVNGQFTVARTGDTAAALTVNLTVTGTATTVTDYTAIPATVTIPAGSAAATIDVVPVDDAVEETGGETVIVTIAAAGAGEYTINAAATAGTVTIADNDAAVTVAVPDVIDQTQAAAEAAITGAGLIVGTVTNANHATIVAGNVISSSPVAATDVATGSAVDLVVSSGPAAGNTVPASLGKQVSELQAIFDAAAPTGTTVTLTDGGSETSSVPVGNVTRTVPAEGAAFPVDGNITYFTSSGTGGGGGTVDLPATLAGLTQAVATTALEALGLTVTTSSASSATVAAGIVISSTPAAGTSVAAGSTVNLVVSSGPAPVGTAGEPIPTLSFWGLLGLSALMPGVVGWMSRKKKMK